MLLLAATAITANSQATTSDEKLRLLMERSSKQAAGSAPVQSAAGLPPERLKERAELLVKGELDLANLHVDAAQQAFEKAALILHAADSEMALVRSYMQAGEYRRALGFGAHTAGAHLDVVGGTALYAWLLNVGGQEAVAQRLLDDTLTRMPNSTLIKSAQQQLASGTPLATGELLALPLRLAPYSELIKLPKGAHIASSAMLLADSSGTSASSRFALVPFKTTDSNQTQRWVRNGLGQVSAAKVAQRLPGLGLAVVRLAVPLPLPDGLAPAMNEAFPGSAAYAVQYPIAPGKPMIDAAWPQLHIGFVGGMAAPANVASQDRLLGVKLPNEARGGPVFNAAGQWIGVAVQADSAQGDFLVTTAQLAKAIGANASKFGLVSRPSAPMAGVAATAPATIAADRIYEASLKTALQVITSR